MATLCAASTKGARRTNHGTLDTPHPTPPHFTTRHWKVHAMEPAAAACGSSLKRGASPPPHTGVLAPAPSSKRSALANSGGLAATTKAAAGACAAVSPSRLSRVGPHTHPVHPWRLQRQNEANRARVLQEHTSYEEWCSVHTHPVHSQHTRYEEWCSIAYLSHLPQAEAELPATHVHGASHHAAVVEPETESGASAYVHVVDDWDRATMWMASQGKAAFARAPQIKGPGLWDPAQGVFCPDATLTEEERASIPSKYCQTCTYRAEVPGSATTTGGPATIVVWHPSHSRCCTSESCGQIVLPAARPIYAPALRNVVHMYGHASLNGTSAGTPFLSGRTLPPGVDPNPNPNRRTPCHDDQQFFTNAEMTGWARFCEEAHWQRVCALWPRAWRRQERQVHGIGFAGKASAEWGEHRLRRLPRQPPHREAMPHWPPASDDDKHVIPRVPCLWTPGPDGQRTHRYPPDTLKQPLGPDELFDDCRHRTWAFPRRHITELSADPYDRDLYVTGQGMCDTQCTYKSSGCVGLLCIRARESVVCDDWATTSKFVSVHEARLIGTPRCARMQELVQAPQPLSVAPAFVTLHHADPSLGNQLGVLNSHGFTVRYKVAQVGLVGGLTIDRLTHTSIESILRRINVVPKVDKHRTDWRQQALSDAIQHDRAVAAVCSERAAANKPLPDPTSELLYPATHPAVACNCHRFDPSLRTDPQKCSSPSHFLARGKTGQLHAKLKALGIPVNRRGPDGKMQVICVAESVQHLSNHWQQPARSHQYWKAVTTANKRRAGSKGGSSMSPAKQRTWF